MGYLDQTRKSKRSTQPTLDTSADKECDPASQESLHIANTEKTNLIFSAIEKWEASAMTKQAGCLLPQSGETSMSTS